MNHYPKHILQSAAWAAFRTAWGTTAVIAGKAQFTVHKIPLLPWKIGYAPRVFVEDIDWRLLTEQAKKEHCVFVKIEPNAGQFDAPAGYDIRPGERLFAYATFLIDLQKSEEELLAAMHPKTRYNIGLAQKKGVVARVGHTPEMLAEFLRLQRETARRQRFFIHPDNYYQCLFDVFTKHEMLEIVTGYYHDIPLASMLLLSDGKTLFYPYGGTAADYREAMAPYLVFWEAIKVGKRLGCQTFDVWNCLLPEQESPDHPWYGFHRFKRGFGGELVRFCGAYDLVLVDWLYPLLLVANKLRWILLKTAPFLTSLITRKS